MKVGKGFDALDARGGSPQQQQGIGPAAAARAAGPLVPLPTPVRPGPNVGGTAPPSAMPFSVGVSGFHHAPSTARETYASSAWSTTDELGGVQPFRLGNANFNESNGAAYNVRSSRGTPRSGKQVSLGASPSKGA